ncbi:hypothetical protein ACLB2K_006858 [Fragaria x ananassa]
MRIATPLAQTIRKSSHPYLGTFPRHLADLGTQHHASSTRSCPDSRSRPETGRNTGDTDEFLFSCANCYSRLASTLVMYGNRWGFVHVGVFNKGFVQASAGTWEMFKNIELQEIIDLDLTSSFCFLSGVAGGAICSLVSGTWTLSVHKSYATEVSLYAFLIGYFMPENPNSTQFDSTIPLRIEELQRFQA